MPRAVEQLRDRAANSARELPVRGRAVQVRPGVWWLLGSLWLLKVLLATQLDLFGDEAFYWWEAQHLDWAFDDVPVATPALIALSTGLFGDSVWAVRLPFLLIAAASTWLVGLISQQLGGDERRFEQALVLASAMPLAAFNGLLAVPDVPLTLALMCALHAMLRLLRSQGCEGGAMLGLAMVLGALSHYRWVVPLAVAAVAVLAVPESRILLKQRRIWMFGLGGLALGWMPLAWQQWQAHGQGLWFQFVARHPWEFQTAKLADPLIQAVVVSPVLYVVLIAAAFRAFRGRKPGSIWLASSGLGLLLTYWVLGLFTDDARSWLHWPMPAFLALAPLVAVCRFGLTERVALAIAWLCAAMVGGYFSIVALSPHMLAGTSLYQHNFAGWRSVASLVREQIPAQANQDIAILADDFMLAAQLQFALGPNYRMFAAEHPNNVKHGRQSVLAALGRDESSYRALVAGQPIWYLADQSATPMRVRAERAAGWCVRYPGLRLIDERFIDHGEKRFFLLRSDGLSGDCALPVFGYIDRQLGPWADLEGFLLSPTGAQLEARARMGEHTLPLQHSVLVRGLDTQLPPGSDPRLPRVGINGLIPDDVPDGSWVTLEARAEGGDWVEIAASRIERR